MPNHKQSEKAVPAHKYAIASGTSCFYIYQDGHHFLKTVGDDIQAQKNAKEVMETLNLHESFCELEKAVNDYFDPNLPKSQRNRLSQALARINSIRSQNKEGL